MSTNDRKYKTLQQQQEEQAQSAPAPTTTTGGTRGANAKPIPSYKQSNMEIMPTITPEGGTPGRQVWGDIPDGWEQPYVSPLKKADGTKKTDVTGTGSGAGAAGTGATGTGAAGAGNTGTGAGAVTSNAPVYKDSYAALIKEQYDAIVNRQPFSYNAAEDPLYQQYVDKYVQGGRLAMRDSMGQAAALTGGYGSSYGQAVGQQQYNEYMRSLSDALPELYGQAYDRYEAEGDRMLQNYQMLGDLADDEYAKYRDEYSDYVYNEQVAYDRQQDAYGNLQNLIAATGMIPSAEQLAEAGMSEAEAHALRMEYAKEDPKAAVRKGIITEEEYQQITGKKYKNKTSSNGGYYISEPDRDIKDDDQGSKAEKEYDTGYGTGGYNPDRLWEEYEEYLKS